MKVKLVGEANDYVGKGIAGGEVVIVPPPNSRFAADDASLVGNTCLYGATGGRLFVNGRAGGTCLPPDHPQPPSQLHSNLLCAVPRQPLYCS